MATVFRPSALVVSSCCVLGLGGSALAYAGAEPGCEGVSASQCVVLAIDAMGGRSRLESIKSVALDVIGHTKLMEQSYRQAPFITAYQRDKIVLDLANGRLRDDGHSVWPESDPHQAESDQTLIMTPAGSGYHDPKGDSPSGLSSFDDAQQMLALGPLRVLIAAADAKDLHFGAAETLRSTSHAVVVFNWNGGPVRVLLNAHNHLPDAVETTQQFRDFWYVWGDTQQRVDWDNWKYASGIVYPSNEVVERNGAVWKSSEAIDVQFNPPIDEKSFALDPKVARQSLQGKGWAHPFKADKPDQLADGVSLYPGSWNATIIREDDGIVILETPISSVYTQGIFEQARKQYPGVPIKAVLSTSDSWPHVGGVRYDVAQGVPTYILDLNQPLLDRIVAAPHTIDPDALQTAKKSPDWKIVSVRTDIGHGANRMQLYPLRGAATERQYMVYFPEHHLLYASDTLVIDPDRHTLYDPELMHEVQQAVEREHLVVDTVYAMHQQPVPWKDVVSLLQKAG
jgi:hypothetical protein